MQIDYIIKKSKRHSISAQVTKDCKVLVKAPLGISESAVREFLLSKKEWITRQIEQKQKIAETVEKLGEFSEEEIKKIKKQAKVIIPQRVEYYSKLSGISYNRIFIRLQRSRWGSCSIEGNLNFNCLLVLMPVEILDSVVIHELCHRRHMNHSRAFYAEIDKYFPDYKKCNKWLKQNGHIFLDRVPIL